MTKTSGKFWTTRPLTTDISCDAIADLRPTSICSMTRNPRERLDAQTSARLCGTPCGIELFAFNFNVSALSHPRPKQIPLVKSRNLNFAHVLDLTKTRPHPERAALCSKESVRMGKWANKSAIGYLVSFYGKKKSRIEASLESSKLGWVTS